MSASLLLVAHDRVAPTMAGPGIRALEIARALGATHPVTLAIPHPPEGDLGVATLGYDPATGVELRDVARSARALLVNPFTLAALPWLADAGPPLIVDLYDPFPLESLSFHRARPMAEQLEHHRQTGLRIANRGCQLGDFFVCAHERQRDWWLGMLQANGRINPYTVRDDPSLRSLIDVVPFGLPDQPFDARADGGVEGVEPGDRVILWGGGLWPWLDAATLIRALPALLERVPRARLLFPGTRHPGQGVPEDDSVERARSLAEALGVADRVYFGDWIPYERWPALLAAADVAVTLHPESPEIRVAALRSRVLGYLWARLPIVASEGDVTAALVETHGLGEVVPVGEPAAVAAALGRLLAADRAAMAPRFDAVAERYRWSAVVEPIARFLDAPRRAPDIAAGLERGPCPDERARVRALEATVAGYERGRVMRVMRSVEGLRARLGGSS